MSEELRALAERHEEVLAGPGAAVDMSALQAVREALQAEQAELLRQTLQPR